MHFCCTAALGYAVDYWLAGGRDEMWIEDSASLYRSTIQLVQYLVGVSHLWTGLRTVSTSATGRLPGRRGPMNGTNRSRK